MKTFGPRNAMKTDATGEAVIFLDELDKCPLNLVLQVEFKPLPEQMMYKPFFDLVANKENWKLHIDTMVDAPSGQQDRELFKTMITQAVMFYAGCVPLIVDLKGEKQIAVKAVGYYAAVGA